MLITNNKKLYDSLIDGEHILFNKNGEFINLYASFDLYFINGKDIRDLEFVPSEQSDLENKFRLPLLTNVIDSIEAKLVGTKNLPPIRIDIKKFYETNTRQTIFQACNMINKNIEDNQVQVIYLLSQQDEILFDNIKNYFTEKCFENKIIVENRFSSHEIIKCKK